MRLTLWILALLATPACDRERDASASPAASATSSTAVAASSTAPAASSRPPMATPPPEPAAPPDRLAVGSRPPKVASRAADGREGCGVCASGQAPRLVILGSPEAIARGDTWRDLDAIARLYADNGLDAIAIATRAQDGRLRAVDDVDTVATRLAELRTRHRIGMPAEVALGRATTDAAAFDQLGAITGDPTVVLLDRDGTVRWRGEVGPHWRDLDLAIGRALAPGPVPTQGM